MPNTYAHYRFGNQVKEQVNEDARRIIEANIELFNIGVHGPDILAFYNPLKTNYIKKLGSTEHAEPALKLLEYAETQIKNKDNKAPYLAYMYGVICHFALDSYCHGYVNGRKAKTGIGHNLMEAEFDRMLMKQDGKNPFRFKPANTIIPTKQYADIIAAVSPKVFPREVYKSVRGMRKWCNFYVAPTIFDRVIIYGALLVSGNYSSKNGMIIKHKPNKSCEESNKELLRLYRKAGRMAIKLIDEYNANIFEGKPYCKALEQCFSPQESIENILDMNMNKGI